MPNHTRHIIDYNQLYSYMLAYDASTQQLKVTLDTENNPSVRLSHALTEQLRVECGPGKCGFKRRGNSVTFDRVTRDFSLMLGVEPIGSYTIGTDGRLSQTALRPLTVDETRRMGTFHHCGPYPLVNESVHNEINPALVTLAKNTITTDFHTHSSGQITPRGLISVAMKHKPYYYPTELLRDAGIKTSYADVPQKHRKDIKRVPFPPKERPGVTYPDEVEGIDLHALSEDDLRKLEAHMAMPPDHQSTFTEMENDGYRFRYPMTKDRRLVRDTLKTIAQEYAAQGIDYASISFVGLDDPEMLKIVHDTMEEIRNDPSTSSVDLRFMVGIPRGLPLPKIEELLEKAKILLDSPYIIGVDFLGYEVNKTKQFVAEFEQFAKWANAHKHGACLRVHAGENDKNRDNVKDFLKMASEYQHLHFLVGHGLYGLDDETVKYAKKLCEDPRHPRLTIEFNPSSNIALNNIDDLRKIPFEFAVENNIPFIVSSDSAGMYGTSAVQLGLAAYYGGLSVSGFRTLGEHQHFLRSHQLSYSHRLGESLPGWKTPEGRSTHLEALGERLRAVPKAVIPPANKLDEEAIEAKLKADRVTLVKPGDYVPELEGKRPVIFIGASGETWRRIPKGQQRENAIAVDMLIHALGDNAYIVQGRNKKVGLSKVINQSIIEANEVRAEKRHPQLYNLGILSNPSFDETHSYKHLTHIEQVPGQLLDIADAIIDHAFAHDGVLVAAGGSAFTRDIIQKADLRGVRANEPTNHKMMLLLSNTQGASAEKAEVLHPDYNARDAKQLIKKLYEQQPDLFAKGFSPNRGNMLNKLYEESSKRVASYGYNIVDQNIINAAEATLISRTEVKPPRASHGRG